MATHTTRIPTALLVAACTALALSVPAQSGDVIGTIARAEEALGKGRKEDAAIALREALRMSWQLAGETVRVTLQGTINDLLRKADPLDALRRKAEADAAAILIATADSYAKVKWNATALDLMGRAEVLDQGLAKKPLEELAKVFEGSRPAFRPDPDQPAANDLLVQWFKGGVQPYGGLAWKVSDEGVESPPLGEETVLLLSTRRTEAKASAGVQFLLGDKPGSVGFVFGYKSPISYYLVSLEHGGERSRFQVSFWNGKALEVLLTQQFRLTREDRSKWTTLAVQFDGKQLAARLGSGGWSQVQPAPPDLTGFLGLLVFGASPNKQPVKFRNLRIDP